MPEPGFQGMDVARGREVADRLRARAQGLDQCRVDVRDAAVGLARHWTGGDAARFARDAARIDGLLDRVATHARSMAQTLYEQVQEQVEVSAVADGHGDGPGTPLEDTTETPGHDIPLDPGVAPPTSTLFERLFGVGSPWVPQGLAIDAGGQLTLTTLYNEHDPGEGLLVVQGPDGAVLTTVQLEGGDHYGGVAVHGDHVWVSGDGRVQLYSLSELRAADPGSTVPAHDSFPVEGSSTVTYHDGRLWTAQFDSDHAQQVYAYAVNGDGSIDEQHVRVPLPLGQDVTVPVTSPEQVLDGTKEMQGIAVDDRYIYLSSSEGRDSTHSVLTRIDRVTGERESVDVPSNMAEGIALHGNDLVTTYESGADKYSADGREPRSTTTVRHLD